MELYCFALNKRNQNDNICNKQIKRICGQEEGDFRGIMDSHLLVQEKIPSLKKKSICSYQSQQISLLLKGTSSN